VTSSDALLAQLDATAESWLQVCGSCDAGLPMNCTCPRGDYRRVFAPLAAALKAVLELCEGSNDMRPPFHKLVSADEVVRVIAEQMEGQ
jgi:hypothetical protein